MNREFAALEKKAAQDFGTKSWHGNSQRLPHCRPPLPRSGIRTQPPLHEESAARFRARTPPPLRLHPSHPRNRTGHPPPSRDPEVQDLMWGRAPRPSGPSKARQAFHAQSPSPIRRQETATKLYSREELPPGKKYSGPAIVTEYSATTVIPPDKRFHLDKRQPDHPLRIWRREQIDKDCPMWSVSLKE